MTQADRAAGEAGATVSAYLTQACRNRHDAPSPSGLHRPGRVSCSGRFASGLCEVGEEPVSGEFGSPLESARFFEKMGGAGDYFQLSLAFQNGLCFLVESQDDGVVAANDQERRCPDFRQVGAGQIWSAASAQQLTLLQLVTRQLEERPLLPWAKTTKPRACSGTVRWPPSRSCPALISMSSSRGSRPLPASRWAAVGDVCQAAALSK